MKLFYLLNPVCRCVIEPSSGSNFPSCDLIKRCDKILRSYEEKLHLVEKFTDAKKKMKEIDELAKASESLTDTELREQILKIQNLAGDLVQSF